MADTITLVSVDRIVIDLKAERERINTPRLYKKGQRAVLLSAIDAFEQGNIQGMIDIMQHPNSKALSMLQRNNSAIDKIITDRLKGLSLRVGA